MTRKRTFWKFRDQSLELGPRTLLVGVLNVTPDSFSDGGMYDDPEAAANRALELQDQGADIIDIGAESTKPGSERVAEAEELRRLIPVLKRLKGRLQIPISVDTYKPAVAELALEHGAHIVNDVSGLTWEPELVKVVLKYDAGLIVNHMRGTPQTWAKLPPMRDVMGEIASELEAGLHRATRAGIPADRIVIDPGIGFGKRKEQNSEIIARLGELSRLPVPLLVGPSRKSFLAQETPEATEYATAAAVAAAILNGAYLIRVHDVRAMRPVASTCDAVISAAPQREAAPVTRVARQDAEGQVREQVFGEEPPKRPVRPPTVKRPPVDNPQDLPMFRRKAETPAEDEEAPAVREERDREERPAARKGEIAPRPSHSVGERPAWGRGEDRPPRSGGDRPAWGKSDRPQRSGEDRPSRGDRPPRSGGDRPAWGKSDRPQRSGEDRPSRGDRPPRSGGDRPAWGKSDRPQRSGEDRSPGGPRPPRSGGDRPAWGKSDRPSSGGGKPFRPGQRTGNDRTGAPPRKRSGPPGAGRRGPNTPPRRKP